MKYKVGDKVRIRSKEWYESHKNKFGKIWTVSLSGEGTVCFDQDNAKYCGKEVTIFSVESDNYVLRGIPYEWTDEMIEGVVEEETKFGTASNPLEPKSNANCLTRERVDALATKIDKELPSGNQNVWELPDGYQFVDENGNIINAKKIGLEKKKKEYPKTYEECAKIMNCPIAGPSGWLFNFDANIKDPYYRKIDILMGKFTRLLICRDAYWKMAGEEMGLGKPWEPDWKNGDTHKFVIHVIKDEIRCGVGLVRSDLLSFPTEEMRDTFYENFKSEIERCKDLL